MPKVNEDVVSLKRPITSKDIETVIKNLPKNKSSDPDGFISEFYQTLSDLLPLIFQLFLQY